MNDYGIVTAEDVIGATHAEFTALEAALNQCIDGGHGFEIEYMDTAPHQGVYLYAPDDGYWEELPPEFLVLLGRQIAKNGLEHLEFGVAYCADRPAIGSHGGTSFRIHADGSLEYPKIVWRESTAPSACEEEGTEIVNNAVEENEGEPAKPQGTEIGLHGSHHEFGLQRIPVTALEEPMVRDALRNAELVLGVDSITDKRSVFFGRERLDGGAASLAGQQLRVITFTYDSRTSELTDLCATVEAIKGSCCFEQG